MRNFFLVLAICLTSSLSFATPSISFTALGITCSAGNRTLSNVTISDFPAVPMSGSFVPRIYYRKASGTWYSQPGTLTSGDGSYGKWNFTILSSDLGNLSVNDVVQYYIIAQNTASTPAVASNPSGVNATDVNTIITHPSSPASYVIGGTLSGTYTVGGGGDYSTLAAAIAAYNNSCLGGPVTFSLKDATYSVTTQLLISNVQASATNILTIKPAAGVSVTINGNVPQQLFKIRGSYITIDGNNGVTDRQLTIINNSAGSPCVFGIFSSGFTDLITDITIKNAIIINGSNSFNAIQISDLYNLTSGGYFQNIKINNNSIQKGYSGISAYMSTGAGYGTGVEITGNDLNASGANAIRTVGIYLNGTDGAIVSNNSIGNLNGGNDEDDKAIWLDAGAKNTIVEKNKIDNLIYNGSAGRAAQGIYVSTGITNANILIANNFISNIRGDGYDMTASNNNPIAIALISPDNQSGISIYHNTIYLAGNSIYWTHSASIGVYLNSTSNASIVNNLIVNNLGIRADASTGSSGPMGTIGIYAASSASQFTAIRNNDYWIAPSGAGAKYIGRIGSTGYSTLDSWQTASGETNAKNIQPVFTSTTDLHLVPASNSLLNNTGLVTTITTDIDGETRSVTPDVGADEFSALCNVPVISTQPAAQAVCLGSSVTFSVAASGDGLSYQWRKDGANIAGSTNSTYNIASTSATDTGNYDVVITGSCGNVTSSAVSLTVNTPTSITIQPTSQTACPGSNVTFSITATGSNFSYQWRLNGSNINAATNDNYTVPATLANAGNYDVIVSGACTSATSSVAVLSLISNPVITTQPASQTVCSQTQVSFNVVAQGSGLTYQWDVDGATINGATSDSYSFTPASAGSKAYEVIVTNSCGLNTTSSSANLTVKPSTIITAQPKSVAVCMNAAASFSVTATGDNLSYQWKKNNVAIPSAGASTYSIASVAAADAGNYEVVITGSCETVTSSVVELTVNTAPSITSHPQNKVACVGDNVTFSLTATGTALNYQWRKDGSPINGANSSSYTVANVTSASAGNYDVVISNSCSAGIASSVAVFSLPAANSWLGTVSNDWNNAANWCLGVPTSATDITIASGTVYAPAITGIADIRNLSINNGASVTIAAGGRLNIYGDLVNNGTFTANNGTIAFRGTTVQTVPTVNAGAVIINGAGITLAGNMTIGTALTLTSGHITLGSNSLVLNSSSSGSVNSHIITNGTGSVAVNNIATNAVIIPVAPDAASYNPVTIANGGGKNYTVSVANGITPAIAISNKAINRTWNIVPNTLPASADISLQFSDADANTSASTTGVMEVGVYNGTSWTIVSGAGATPIGTSSARLVTVSTSQFGPLVVTSPGGISYPNAVTNPDPNIQSMQLLPNYVVDNAVLRIHSLAAMKMELIVTDGAGRTIMIIKKTIAAGKNDVLLSLKEITNGLYYITGIGSKGNAGTLKFIKL